MSIVERIAAVKYIATVANVETLTREYIGARSAADRTGGTYLDILIACTQQRVSGRGRRKSALDALEAIHKEFYPAILRVAGEGSESSVETNRRATFARTNKATLAAYLRAGLSVMDLVPGQTSKRQLRAAITPPPAQNKTERILTASKDSILRAVRREAKRDLDAARRNLERLIDDLMTELDEFKDTDEVEVTGTHLSRHEPPPRIRHHA